MEVKVCKYLGIDFEVFKDLVYRRGMGRVKAAIRLGADRLKAELVANLRLGLGADHINSVYGMDSVASCEQHNRVGEFYEAVNVGVIYSNNFRVLIGLETKVLSPRGYGFHHDVVYNILIEMGFKNYDPINGHFVTTLKPEYRIESLPYLRWSNCALIETRVSVKILKVYKRIQNEYVSVFSLKDAFAETLFVEINRKEDNFLWFLDSLLNKLQHSVIKEFYRNAGNKIYTFELELEDGNYLVKVKTITSDSSKNASYRFLNSDVLINDYDVNPVYTFFLDPSQYSGSMRVGFQLASYEIGKGMTRDYKDVITYRKRYNEYADYVPHIDFENAVASNNKPAGYVMIPELTREEDTEEYYLKRTGYLSREFSREKRRKLNPHHGRKQSTYSK